MSFENKIRRLDIFKKVPKDLSQGTNIGGALSLLTAASIIAFLVIQIYYYLNPDYNTIIMPMRPHFKTKMRVNIDILFNKLPCQLVTMQQQDAVLSYNMELKDVIKTTVDEEGNLISEYQEPNKQNFNQASYMEYLQAAKTALIKGHGCRLKGFFIANQVPGIIKFSAEGSFELIAMLMAEGLLTRLDTSHKVYNFSFGDPKNIEKIKVEHRSASLDGLKDMERQFDVNWKARYMHYHLDVIPTYYVQGFSVIDTYQYTWKFNEAITDELPVIYFQYQVAGIAVEVNRHRQIIWTFLMELCSVIGGTFAIGSFLSKIISSIFQDKYIGYELVQ